MSGVHGYIGTLKAFRQEVLERPERLATTDTEAAAVALHTAATLFNQAKKIETKHLGSFDKIPPGKYDDEQIWAIMEERQSSLNAWRDTILEDLEDVVAAFASPPLSPTGSDLEEEDLEEQDAGDLSDDGADLDLSQNEDNEADETAHFSYDEEEDFSASEEEEEEEATAKVSEEKSEDENQYDEDIEENSMDERDPLAEAEEGELGTDDEDEDMAALHDGFFTATDMDKFADKVERVEAGEESEEEEEDEEIDYFKDPDMEEDDNEEDEEEIDASDVMYNNFFKPPREVRPWNAGRSDHKGKGKGKSQSVHFTNKSADQQSEDDASDASEAEGPAKQLFGDDEDEEDASTGKSPFEIQQERLQKRIAALEAEAIAGKAWTLGGETNSKARPINSLLEEDLDFEHANKVAPIITEEKTESLEDLIKKRIIDNNFDDVVRKRDPNASRPFRPSSAVELDDQKSKQSLAQIYEDEYVRSTADTALPSAQEEAMSAQHTEVDDLWRSLRAKLDAMSDSHYVPKPPQAEVRVISDAPALMMEEAQPMAVGDASRLAPEEVYEKKRGDLKGETELTQEERKALRQRKKRLYKHREAQKPLEKVQAIKALGEE